ncbi:uncharacterized protein [Amphiura filiformis]|uniref:uncharacterized protein n=1 Tax=Amphiura filiformis TaxID=82378 RepID=UPI003B2222ED
MAPPDTTRNPAIMFDKFDPDVEDFECYQDRLEQYWLVAGIDKEADRVATLISVIGAKYNRQLRDMSAPTKPKDLKFSEICEKLNDYYNPKKTTLANRYKFYRRTQKEGESIADFLVSLKKLAQDCAFGNFRETAIRDIFLCGLKNKAIKRRLFAKEESVITLDKVEKIAISMETADRETEEIKDDEKKTAVKRVELRNMNCYCCGKNNHMKKDCKYRSYTCENCGRKGHLRSVCQSSKGGGKSTDSSKTKSTSTSSKKHRRKKSTYYKKKSGVHKFEDSDSEYSSSDQDDSDFTDESNVHFINALGSKHDDPIVTKMRINDVSMEMEVDTGCGKSLISHQEFREKFGRMPIQKTSVKFKTITGESLKVHGKVMVKVKGVDGKSEKVPLYVIGEKGKHYPSLLGRDWLTRIQLDWKRIFDVKRVQTKHAKTKSIEEEISMYDVFKEGRGCIKDVKVKLELVEDAKPKFYKPRPVPFALKDKVADELEKMVKDGVLEKVDYSDWATPIVPVRKPSGDVRVCGDYKITINPVLKAKEHPLPTPDELLLKLNGGQKFSKLDMSSTYQQVQLDENSREYVTINSHLGLFRFTRLAFGISSANAIFQELMEKILTGLEGVAVFVDDIIITGINDDDHKKNLKGVLGGKGKYTVWCDIPTDEQPDISKFKKSCEKSERGVLVVCNFAKVFEIDEQLHEAFNILLMSDTKGVHLITVGQQEEATSKEVAKMLDEQLRTNFLVQEGIDMTQFVLCHHTCSDLADFKLSDLFSKPMPSFWMSATKLNPMLEALVVTLNCTVSSFAQIIGEQSLFLLTESQCNLLWSKLQSHQTLFIHGLPGTGKTLMAGIIARHLMNRSGPHTVLYICETKPLADFMQKNTAGLRAITREYFKENSDKLKYQHILIDEAQNFRDEVKGETFHWYRKAKQIVKENAINCYSRGYLWVFLDMSQKEHRFPSGLPRLSYQRDKMYLLCEVVRNPKHVFDAISKTRTRSQVRKDDDLWEGFQLLYDSKLLPKTDVIHRVKGYVEQKIVRPFIVDNVTRQILQIVLSHREANCKVQNMVVLVSTVGHGTKYIKALERQAKPHGIEVVTDSSKQNNGCLLLESVRRFSGLERTVVIAIDLDVASEMHCSKRLYIQAISRSMMNVYLLEKTEIRFLPMQMGINPHYPLHCKS